MAFSLPGKSSRIGSWPLIRASVFWPAAALPSVLVQIAADYASTEPTSSILQALLVLPDRVGDLHGAGWAARCLSPAAGGTGAGHGAESGVAVARASTVAGPDVWPPIGFAFLRPPTPAQRLVGSCLCPDRFHHSEGHF